MKDNKLEMHSDRPGDIFETRNQTGGGTDDDDIDISGGHDQEKLKRDPKWWGEGLLKLDKEVNEKQAKLLKEVLKEKRDKTKKKDNDPE